MTDRAPGAVWLPTVLRPRAVALITAQAVVLDAGRQALPLLRVRPADPLIAAVTDLLLMMDDAGVFRQRLHLVVSDFFARPAILPLPDRACSDDAISALMAGHYRQVYADPVADWRFCWQRRVGQLLAVAWPADALSLLTDGLAQRRCVLAMARPLGLELATRLPSPPGEAWLIVISQRCASIFRLQRGALQDWVVCASALLSQSVPIQLARSAALRDDDCRNLWVLDLTGSGDSVDDPAHDTAVLRQTLVARGWTWHPFSPVDLARHRVWPLHPRTPAHSGNVGIADIAELAP